MQITITYVPDRFFGLPHVEVENHETSEVALVLSHNIEAFVSTAGISNTFPQEEGGSEGDRLWELAQKFEAAS